MTTCRRRSITGTPGAEDSSEALTGVRVCAPPPPTCAADGSLVFDDQIPGGVSCGGEVPDPSRVGDPCDESRFPGCGCGCGASGGGAGGALLGGLVLLAVGRRRRGR